MYVCMYVCMSACVVMSECLSTVDEQSEAPEFSDGGSALMFQLHPVAENLLMKQIVSDVVVCYTSVKNNVTIMFKNCHSVKISWLRDVTQPILLYFCLLISVVYY